MSKCISVTEEFSLIPFCAAEASLHGTGQRVSFIGESREFIGYKSLKTQEILPSIIIRISLISASSMTLWDNLNTVRCWTHCLFLHLTKAHGICVFRIFELIGFCLRDLGTKTF